MTRKICSKCGSSVGDEATHAAWHEALEFALTHGNVVLTDREIAGLNFDAFRDKAQTEYRPFTVGRGPWTRTDQ